MKERSDGEMDFQALEKTAGVKLGVEEREGLEGTRVLYELLSNEPLRGLSGRERKRNFSEGIRAGERFLKFLDFFLKLTSREYGRADIRDAKETREKILLAAMPIMDLQKKLSRLLPALDEHQHDWRGKPGRPKDLSGPVIFFANKIYRSAGGAGIPTYRLSRHGSHYEGGSLSFVQEFLTQIGCAFQSRDALAQAILRITDQN